MQIMVLIGTVGASPHIGDFLDCPVLSFFSRERAQVELLNRFSCFMAQTTCCHVRKCLLGVRMMGDVIWVKYAPIPPKMGVNRQFQAKTAKYKNYNGSLYVSLKPKFKIIIIIIIMHEFHRDASLETKLQGRYVSRITQLHYSYNVNAAVADSLHCRMICGTVP